MCFLRLWNNAQTRGKALGLPLQPAQPLSGQAKEEADITPNSSGSFMGTETTQLGGVRLMRLGCSMVGRDKACGKLMLSQMGRGLGNSAYQQHHVPE